MNKTTKFFAAGAVAMTAMTPAFAGQAGAPIIEDAPVVVVEDAGSSIGSLPLALLALAVVGIAVAISQNEDN
ncbi:hypothetical protein [Aliiroseovarius subalbicans]|uniref:hypothetical protein n=1 Tax=Aliiroseovarius subalbicans TaxID=2925840 RepID=UPI001F59CA22|nr:hypothetical protein [Aliiroseovarius subalbicans]MCI2400243.1 hypothetical protein [Aliiroseovarius subalbicans]